jgi:uncharacterized membrane protein
MYEVKKNRSSRSYAIRFFAELPWIVRAFLNLFIVLLVGIVIFGLLGKFSEIQVFDKVSEELMSFLKVVVGAIIGSLSSEAKNYIQRKDSEITNDQGTNAGEN